MTINEEINLPQTDIKRVIYRTTVTHFLLSGDVINVTTLKTLVHPQKQLIVLTVRSRFDWIDD